MLLSELDTKLDMGVLEGLEAGTISFALGVMASSPVRDHDEEEERQIVKLQIKEFLASRKRKEGGGRDVVRF